MTSEQHEIEGTLGILGWHAGRRERIPKVISGRWRKVKSGSGIKKRVRGVMKDTLCDGDGAAGGRRSTNLGVLRPMEEGG